MPLSNTRVTAAISSAPSSGFAMGMRMVTGGDYPAWSGLLARLTRGASRPE
jgi:hypothetical protein